MPNASSQARPLHRHRRGRNPIRNTLQTILELRRYVGALAEFGDLLEAHGDAKLRPFGDLTHATMRYIDGELDALEDDFRELDALYQERKARKPAATS